jgi:hypothetical protein
MVARAKDLVVKEWPINQPKVDGFKLNSGLVKGCPSMQRFTRAVNHLAGSKTDEGLRNAVLDKGRFRLLFIAPST